MSTFEGAVLEQTVAVARQHNIEPPALLAVVTVESAGKSLEVDGKTPCLLFERHIFYRELNKAKKTGALAMAVAAGLANQTWQPKTQYKDQNTSARRLDLFRRARNIDEECAIRSCSWGVGQTMGFLAEEMKFHNAREMWNYMVAGGVPAQVECMVREIQNKNLIKALNSHNWVGFAKVYNGPGYAKNNYDTKMAIAYQDWSKKPLPDVVQPQPIPAPTPPPPEPKPSPAPPVVGGGIAAVLAAIYAWFSNPQNGQYIAFGVFILILIAMTAFVLYRRRQDAMPQLGVLTIANEEA